MSVIVSLQLSAETPRLDGDVLAALVGRCGVSSPRWPISPDERAEQVSDINRGPDHRRPAARQDSGVDPVPVLDSSRLR